MTRIRQIIRYIKELESGYDRTLEAIPTETLFLRASQPVSGQYLPFDASGVDDEGLDDLISIPTVWKPTEEPTPSRWYPARTKSHSRGSLVNGKTRKAITFSSTYERNLAYMMCASKHVVLVEDQPSAVLIRQEDGTSKHTVDYRATMSTGTVIVVGVRPSDMLEKDGLAFTIGTLDQNLPHGFADGATIITEKEATDARCWNAKSILRALKHSSKTDNDRLRDYASRFHGTVHIRDLLAGWGIPAHGWNAVWCLIHDEILEPVRPDLMLVDAPFVKFNHKN
ncbi:hypothetical protein [Agrobacterium rosae]|uniref:hypothetical protein n=1 Tax=Agrobacterium rosae TaxID=1972867 RepID=UPI003BA1E0DC